MEKTASPISQTEILRMFRARVSRLANPDTALAALKEVHGEVLSAVGERDNANRLFYEAVKFYDGILLGFEWGWRAARWVRPKEIEDVDRIVIGKLMKNPELTNSELCEQLDAQRVELTAKFQWVNPGKLKKVLGKDKSSWKWKSALGKIHAVEVNLSDWRNEAQQFADALWWHQEATKHYRRFGRIDWARRSAVIKKQTPRRN